VIGVGVAGLVTTPSVQAQWGVQTEGQIDPNTIPKYVDPLVIPPAMPKTAVIYENGKKVDYYEIAVRQFQQQILPVNVPLPGVPYPTTTVWSYGLAQMPGTVAEGGTFNFPAFTIEAKTDRPVRVKWINDLVGADGSPLPHLLPVDQTLHWANPVGDEGPDSRGSNPEPYTGPVPIVTHVHGAHTTQDSDGYPEAWFLPAGAGPLVSNPVGSKYDQFANEFATAHGANWAWGDGYSYYQYPNHQRATTLWYHDHSLGMTRLNVYAGPAGFYLLRGGSDDRVRISGTNQDAVLPGPAPKAKDFLQNKPKKYREIPIVIQERSFDVDGQLFYPDNRAFFEGLPADALDTVPQIPSNTSEVGDNMTCDGMVSDVSPIWIPEFFGSTLVTNGKTWPYLQVKRARYRFRYLNGCQSRFLILEHDYPLPFVQIGADGGFLANPEVLNRLLIAPAERADVIVDFSNVPVGTEIILKNLGPDEPFGGGDPDVDFAAADPNTTGQVMKFIVMGGPASDDSTPSAMLRLPPIADLGAPNHTRRVSLNEEESANVAIATMFDFNGDESWALDSNGQLVPDCDGAAFGPTAAKLGTVNDDGTGTALLWMQDLTETPLQGDVEVWEIHNFTADAHPIHIHLVQFQVVDRTDEGGVTRAPESWESGFKDTVISYPGEITRVKARFDIAGLYVWHCHILEHEDNEMMRPYEVVANPNYMPPGGGGNGGGGDQDDDDDDDGVCNVPWGGGNDDDDCDSPWGGGNGGDDDDDDNNGPWGGGCDD
jgi:bilirubin oxidase